MSHDIFDKLSSSYPVNKATALANSGGYSYKRKTNARETFNAPPKIKDVPFNAENLAGNKRGRLTVVGMAATGNHEGARWVVRCVCGNYEYRRAKSIKNIKNVGDCCQDCHNTIYLKKMDWETQFGRDKANELKDKELKIIG